ncbi:glycerophosphodiester phosphodiesterase family protein [Xinfangfangia sp. CPCC 101601]|uniref:Glycerophosphodiester phosphodiesterase family protein n=1 Tax=Pseudogemmobacter lacusdianii TaxID=3069608 RepID=A0ABU0W198_9RHOB|nr:glycerophosphodiester phosphodiesterase family protein [Xinfangfangia sp. CPCC 101601]MDQ2066870.1 glycerophosphodiester phosphodiesterase family protein [Xinfangfangia sp. CPCC 101601]
MMQEPRRTPLPSGFLTRPIAHRALHDRAAGRIENSPAAIRAAIAHGYAIEIDLQLSRDGVAMVFHDETLERLTDETGFVSERSATELGQIRLKDSSENIPTLTEVLKIVAGQVPLLIEIKDQSLVMGPTDGRLEAATAKALAAYTGEVALMSFNPACIYHLAKLAPNLPRGLTTAAYDEESWAPLPPEACEHFRAIPDYDATLSSFISHEAADLASPRVAELKASGADILCWTIRSAAEETKARAVAQNVTFEGYLSPLPA